jgi:hypothetical protein
VSAQGHLASITVWDYAWGGRRKPWHGSSGQEILCIGCLESRIGRTLMSRDFKDVPINNLAAGEKSARLRNRLSAKGCAVVFGQIPWMTDAITAAQPVTVKR